MRTIATHYPADHTGPIKINVLDQPAGTGASCVYAVHGLDMDRHAAGLAISDDPETEAFIEACGDMGLIVLPFQCGNPATEGVNGLTFEVLLAIMKDRLEAFQAGPFACAENANALTNIGAALNSLHGRTRRLQPTATA